MILICISLIIMILVYISLMISDVEHFFFHFSLDLYIFFGKMSKVFAHLKKIFLLFLLLSCMRSLYITRWVVCRYFLPFERLPFHCAVSFALQKCFRKFDVVLFFILLMLCCIPKIVVKLMSRSFSLFSSSSVTISGIEIQLRNYLSYDLICD